MKTIGSTLLLLFVSVTGIGQASEFTYYHSVWWNGNTLYASGTSQHDDGDSVSAESYIDYQGGTTSTNANCDYFVASTSSTMTAANWKVGEWVVKFLFYYLLGQTAEEVLGELANPVTGFTFGELLLPWYLHRKATESCPGPGGSVEPAICDEGVTTQALFNPSTTQDYLRRQYWAWRIGSSGFGCHKTTFDNYQNFSANQFICTNGN